MLKVRELGHEDGTLGREITLSDVALQSIIDVVEVHDNQIRSKGAVLTGGTRNRSVSWNIVNLVRSQNKTANFYTIEIRA